MRAILKTSLYAILVTLGSSLLIQILQYFLKPAEEGINWPISLGWGSMLIPALFISFRYGLLKNDEKPFAAILGCAFCWAWGYFLHFRNVTGEFVGYDMWASIFIYASLTWFVWDILKQKVMGILSAIMVIFGVIMCIANGAVIDGAWKPLRYAFTADYYWWRLGSDIIYGLMLLPPAYQYFRIEKRGPKKEAQVFSIREQKQKAA